MENNSKILKYSLIIAVLLVLSYAVVAVIDIYTLDNCESPSNTPQASFQFIQQESNISVQHKGGDDLEADKTYIKSNINTWVWADLDNGDTTISTGENVSFAITDSADIRVEYQYPPPDRSPFNPFEEPCYTDRNQTIAMFQPG